MIQNEKINVGGQAVIEGVMMRSPHSMAIVVRKPDGGVASKEKPWVSISEKMKIFKLPFFRGTIVLFEALFNGMEALVFSANQAVPEEDDKLSTTQMVFTIIFALLLAMVLFVALPHILTAYLDFSIRTFKFHAVDGFIKISFFLLYIWGISFSKDIKRIFQYHGAEHKAIFTYEAGEELTVENARKYTTLHPRCGTSFVLMVLLISILFFSVVFPFLPQWTSFGKVYENSANILIKIFLLFPIAGISYEITRLSGKKPDNPVIKFFIFPGLMMQKITTKEPTDDQLEIALESIKKALLLENEFIKEKCNVQSS